MAKTFDDKYKQMEFFLFELNNKMQLAKQLTIALKTLGNNLSVPVYRSA